MIAHSCGCDEPRKLTREQARIMGPSGVSVSLAEYYERWSAPHSIHALNGIDRPKFEHAGLQGAHGLHGAAVVVVSCGIGGAGGASVVAVRVLGAGRETYVTSGRSLGAERT